MKIYQYGLDLIIPLEDRLVVVSPNDVTELQAFNPSEAFTASEGHQKAVRKARKSKDDTAPTEKKKRGRPRKAPADTTELADDEPLQQDFGLGFQSIALLIEAKRNGEQTDEELAEEYDILPRQVKILWNKYHKDSRFNV